IRLAGQEVVEVVLPRWPVPGPGALAGGVQPVVRRPAAGARAGPHVEVAVRGAAAARRVHEPGVSRAPVIGHPGDQHPTAALAGIAVHLPPDPLRPGVGPNPAQPCYAQWAAPTIDDVSPVIEWVIVIMLPTAAGGAIIGGVRGARWSSERWRMRRYRLQPQ